MVPKGFFPNEDTGQILVVTEAPQDISFDGMAKLQQEAAAIILTDPAVDAVNSSIGTSGLSSSLNQGRLFVGLKPLEDRHGVKVDAVIQRLSQKQSVLPDMQVFLQSIKHISVGGRPRQSQYPYSIQGVHFQTLQEIVPTLEK